MKRRLIIVILLFIGLSWQSPIFAEPSYKPARVTSAGDAYVPFQVMIDGFFVFDVLLNDDGTVKQIDALRNPGAMPGAAKTSMRELEISAGFQERGASIVTHDRKLCLPPAKLR
jgi:hypothetical protein